MKTKKPARRKAHNDDSTITKTLRAGAGGLLITCAIGGALLLGACAIVLATPDPTSLIDPVGYVALLVTAILGGLFSSKLNPRAPYLTSGATGIGFTLLSMLASLAVPHTLDSGLNIGTRLLLHTFALLSFPLGAFLGIKSNNKPKKRRRR